MVQPPYPIMTLFIEKPSLVRPTAICPQISGTAIITCVCRITHFSAPQSYMTPALQLIGRLGLETSVKQDSCVSHLPFGRQIRELLLTVCILVVGREVVQKAATETDGAESAPRIR